jgi:hypothetical protein
MSPAGLNSPDKLDWVPGARVLNLTAQRVEQFVTRRRFTFAAFRRKILP